jgi:hypothetical protein
MASTLGSANLPPSSPASQRQRSSDVCRFDTLSTNPTNAMFGMSGWIVRCNIDLI